MNRNIYQEPLVSRYTSRAMQEIFSEKNRIRTWRRCWIALAEAQYELGLELVTAEMVQELKDHQDDIDFEVAAAKEKEIRHDVMAHVYAYGLKCPTAEPIIHLGATSQFVGCNSDLLIQRQGLAADQKGPAQHHRQPEPPSPADTKGWPPWDIPTTNRPSPPRSANAIPCISRIY